MYFACIKLIKAKKKGQLFSEAQPVLNDITAVYSWDKVTCGLFKMFKAEVLSNLNVLRNLKFGSLLVWTEPVDDSIKSETAE